MWIKVFVKALPNTVDSLTAKFCLKSTVVTIK